MWQLMTFWSSYHSVSTCQQSELTGDHAALTNKHISGDTHKTTMYVRLSQTHTQKKPKKKNLESRGLAENHGKSRHLAAAIHELEDLADMSVKSVCHT